MSEYAHESSSDPNVHVDRIKSELDQLIRHLRDDTQRVNDPQAKALFETSAETLSGLVKAFNDYQRRNEPAWKKP